MNNTQAVIDPEIEIIMAEDGDVDFKIIERSLRSSNLNNPITRALDGIETLEIIEKKPC